MREGPTRVLVTGAAGQLGNGLIAAASRWNSDRCDTGVVITGLDRNRMDISRTEVVSQVMDELVPEVVVHAAAWTDVDGCEVSPRRAMEINAEGTVNLVRAAGSIGAHLCFISTDYVFDGQSSRPYSEMDLPRPINVYGRSKLEGERSLRETDTVIRTSWLSGSVGRNFVKTVISLLEGGSGPLRFVDDQRGCPTFVDDLAPVVLELALSRSPGIHHVTNSGDASWYDLARAVADIREEDVGRVEAIATRELDPPRPARRPAYSVLDNARLRQMGLGPLPDWREGLTRLVVTLGKDHRRSLG